MRFPYPGTHISKNMYVFPGRETDITRDRNPELEASISTDFLSQPFLE